MRTANFDAHPGSDWGSEGDGSPVKSALRDHVRLRLLVGAHVLGGLLACGYSAIEGRIPFVLEDLPRRPPPGDQPQPSLLVGHLGGVLRGIQVDAAGRVDPGGRLLGDPPGHRGRRDEFSGMAAMASVGVAVALLTARNRGARLLRHPKPSDPPAPEGSASRSGA